ncbi:extracellular solute-binding protein [Candidatus Nucleicultrix amoebiphila]|jgi:microcin C transport system substrate-binding protein|uniref:Solute-binding protein family 5 domain-containing protein n=1 Tax=Candidatus Nucleicultrix amoebiphila FS5 TaxID=1414854 RepID=A0A1W6N464_9PROT|nr:extracellular solute-binding protein [Candidatus Nucleicultrix amoebiphila]ARN84645.1 hypothetical protein GQ61_04215 [Candidatus Nucleicultrix amoebiphila FS5]
MRLWLSFLTFFLIFASLTQAADKSLGVKHGISLFNAPLHYPKNFTHFDYVNPNAPQGGEIVFRAIGSFDSFNPFVVKGTPVAGMTILFPSLMHATLSRRSYDRSQEDYGYAAETIEWSEDNTWVIYTLRSDITFHDGSPITADDVIYSFNTLIQKGSPLYKSYYQTVKNVEKSGERGVKFTFINGDSREQAMIVGEMPILSRAYYEKVGFEKADLTPPIGSGPYKIEKFEAGHSITYVKVDNWWGKNLAVNKGRYNIERIRYDYYRDDIVAFEAFKSGDYDVRIESSTKNWVKGYDIPQISRGDIIKLQVKDKNPRPAQVLIYNTRRELFKDKLFRQALVYALDFEWANKNLFYSFYKRLKSYFENSEYAATGLPQGDELKLLNEYKDKLPSEVFTTVFSPPISGSQEALRKNLGIAESLLKKAGFEVDQKRKVLTDPKYGKPVKVEILIQDANLQRALHNFIENLRKIGIEATLRMVDAAQYERRIENYEFDICMQVIPQSSSPGNEQREFWGSDRADIVGGRNYAGIKDPIVDALVEKLIDSDDHDTLVQRTRALDRVLQWGFYTIPLWYSDTTNIAHWKKVHHPDNFPEYGIDIDAFWVDQKPVNEK